MCCADSTVDSRGSHLSLLGIADPEPLSAGRVPTRATRAGWGWTLVMKILGATGGPASGRLSRPSVLRRWFLSAAAATASLMPMISGSLVLASIVFVIFRKRSKGVWLLVVAIGATLLNRAPMRCPSTARPRDVDNVGPTPGAQRTVVRLVTANLWNGADDVGAIVEEISQADPDIVVLQEVTPRHLARLDALGVFQRYRANAVTPERGHAGIGIWTRFEIEELEWVVVSGERQLRAWILTPDGGRVRLYAVHAPAPVPSKVDRWRSWFEAMARDVRREMEDHALPVIVAGDFNATVGHRPFRRLVESGLCDAAIVAGCGRYMTWSTRWRGMPPLFRIDHVLVRADIRLDGYRVGTGVGSDHRPVFVDLGILG